MSASQSGFPSPGQPASPESSFGIYRVMLVKVQSGTGVPYNKTYSGTLEVLESAARSTLRHNLRSGWWSVPGLIGTPFALAGTRRR